MIRVLHCVVGMNYGGYETFIMNVYRNINRQKVQFDFITSLEGVFDDEIKSLGGRVYRIPFITKVGPFGYNKHLKNFLQKHSEYKILHSHMDKFSGMTVRAAYNCNVPIRIAHSHSTDNEGSFAYKLVKNYYGSMINRYCNHRFACSEPAGEWLFGDKSFYVVKNGIDIKRYLPNNSVRQEVRKELGLKNSFVVGHVGRFMSAKNHLFLIEVFAQLKTLKPNAMLLLVGDGETKQSIATRAKELEVEKDIIFYGTTDNVAKVLQAMDVFVFPSTHEGLGIALVEAQAAGLGCIAADTVPTETDFTGNVKYLSLNLSVKSWAEQIAGHNGIKNDISNLATNAGYDISDTADYLERYYIDCVGSL